MEGRKTRNIKLGRWERRAWGEAKPTSPLWKHKEWKAKVPPCFGQPEHGCFSKLRSRVRGAWYITGEYFAGWPWAWRMSSIKHLPDLSSSGIEWLPEPGCRAALRLGCRPSRCQLLPSHARCMQPTSTQSLPICSTGVLSRHAALLQDKPRRGEKKNIKRLELTGVQAWYQNKLGGNSEKGQCSLRLQSAPAIKGHVRHRTPAEVTRHKDQFSEVPLVYRQKRATGISLVPDLLQRSCNTARQQLACPYSSPCSRVSSPGVTSNSRSSEERPVIQRKSCGGRTGD